MQYETSIIQQAAASPQERQRLLAAFLMESRMVQVKFYLIRFSSLRWPANKSLFGVLTAQDDVRVT